MKNLFSQKQDNLIDDAAALMPSFSRRVHESLVKARNQRFYQELLNVRPDSVDDRDLIYQPGLVEIKNRLNVPGLFKQEIGETREHLRLRRRLIRRQGGEGSCAGQALSAVIDIQNLIRTTGNRDVTLKQLTENSPELLGSWLNQRVSSRMLYEMARSLDENPEDRVVGSTLRNAIKAFGQNGVCSEISAPHIPGEVGWYLTIRQAKEARRTGLGSYYRLRATLYDYHAALNEVGAIYVSAMIHQGWHWKQMDITKSQNEDSEKTARAIIYPGIENIELVGGHAFAIIGYDETGFLVLNSWGHGWGMWNDPVGNLKKGLPGIAHWSYEDWQDNVLDAWVFRLTVPSPKVFKMEGGYGKGIDPITGRRFNKTPRFMVNGHYINLKNGKFVRTGNLPNTELVFKTTRDLLENRLTEARTDTSQRQYFDVLVGVNNGLEPISQGIHFAASLVRVLKEHGVYPLLVYWNYALLSQIENLIAANLSDIKERSGSSPATMERSIERYMRDYRGYFWDRLTENVVKTAGTGRTPIAKVESLDLYKALLPIVRVAVRHPEIRLHFIAHSDGVLVLDRLLKNLCRSLVHIDRKGVEQFATACRTVTLISPLCRRSDMRGIEQVAKTWRKIGMRRRIDLATLSKADELRDRTGAYAHTFPYLAQSVYFPGHRLNEKELVCGLHDNAVHLKSSPYYAHMVCPEVGIDALRSHFGMIRNPGFLNAIFNNMLGREEEAAQDIISSADLFSLSAYS